MCWKIRPAPGPAPAYVPRTEPDRHADRIRAMIATIKATGAKPYVNTHLQRGLMVALTPACAPCCIWSALTRLVLCPWHCCDASDCSKGADGCITDWVALTHQTRNLGNHAGFQLDARELKVMLDVIEELQGEFAGVGVVGCTTCWRTTSSPPLLADAGLRDVAVAPAAAFRLLELVSMQIVSLHATRDA